MQFILGKKNRVPFNYPPPGTSDSTLPTDAYVSRRVVTTGSVTQFYGICDVGHQGLVHDEECGLVYNRARHVQPLLARFIQRDPLGYVDGANLYVYASNRPLSFHDASGQNVSRSYERMGGDSDQHEPRTAQLDVELQIDQSGCQGSGATCSGAVQVYLVYRATFTTDERAGHTDGQSYGLFDYPFGWVHFSYSQGLPGQTGPHRGNYLEAKIKVAEFICAENNQFQSGQVFVISGDPGVTHSEEELRTLAHHSAHWSVGISCCGKVGLTGCFS